MRMLRTPEKISEVGVWWEKFRRASLGFLGNLVGWQHLLSLLQQPEPCNIMIQWVNWSVKWKLCCWKCHLHFPKSFEEPADRRDNNLTCLGYQLVTLYPDPYTTSLGNLIKDQFQSPLCNCPENWSRLGCEPVVSQMAPRRAVPLPLLQICSVPSSVPLVQHTDSLADCFTDLLTAKNPEQSIKPSLA